MCSGEDGGYQYALGSGQEDMRALSKALNGKLNGRGGGSALWLRVRFRLCRKISEKLLRMSRKRRE